MAKPRRAKNAHPSDEFYSPRQLDDLTEDRQALLEEALAGSIDAHGALLISFRPRMLRYFAERISRALRRKMSEEDLASMANLHALSGFARFFGRGLKNYWAWLRQICHNVLKAMLRLFSEDKRDLSREEVLDELKLDDGSQHPHRLAQKSPLEIIEALETAGQLQAALERLDADERQIVTLRFIEGLRLKQVADRLGLSEDAVKRACKSIVARLKQRFAAAYAG